MGHTPMPKSITKPLTEAQTQAKIIKRMTDDGWFVVKLIQTNRNGIPDLVAHKEGKTLYVEVKAINGRVSPLQAHRITELTKAGIPSFIVRTETEINDIIANCEGGSKLPEPRREGGQQGMEGPIF
jgi:hypothetical protein